MDLIILWWWGQRLYRGRRNVLVWEGDPEVFEVKLFGFNPSNFEWLQAFGQLGVLPVGSMSWAGLCLCPGAGGGCLVQPGERLVGGERDAQSWVLLLFPGFWVACVHHFLVARYVVS